MNGEAALVTPEIMSDWKEKTLPDILAIYNADDIYNVDESGLFYQYLPNKTFTLQAEKASRGIKEFKQRLTILVGANMAGNDKLEPVVIGKAAKPRCFRGINRIPLPYYSNAKAWMTSQVWTDWIQKFDYRMKTEGRKIALIIDNCPAHPIVSNLTNVDVFYLPPNTTSHTQPCDQGIIQALKMKYRSILLKKFLDAVDDGIIFRANVLDAIVFLCTAWSNVVASTIVNCFAHCGFRSTVHLISDEIETDDTENVCCWNILEQLLTQVTQFQKLVI